MGKVPRLKFCMMGLKIYWMITLRLILRLHLPAMKTVEFWGAGMQEEL